MRRLQMFAAVLVVCISLFYSVPRIVSTVSAVRAFTIASGAVAHRAVAHDVSPALSLLVRDLDANTLQDTDSDRPLNVLPPDADADEGELQAQPPAPPVITAPAGSATVEQTTHGTKPPPRSSRASMGLAWDSMARRARRRCAILRTTPWRSARITSYRSSIREWRSSRRRAGGSTRRARCSTAPSRRTMSSRDSVAVRDAQQRRRGGPIRPARRPLADRHADLLAHRPSRPPRGIATGARPGRGQPGQPA